MTNKEKTPHVLQRVGLGWKSTFAVLITDVLLTSTTPVEKKL